MVAWIKSEVPYIFFFLSTLYRRAFESVGGEALTFLFAVGYVNHFKFNQISLAEQEHFFPQNDIDTQISSGYRGLCRYLRTFDETFS